MGPCHRRDVAQSVAIWGDLDELTGFADLLYATVDVSEFGFRIHDGLSIHLDTEGPETMGHGVLGPHRDPHLCHGRPSLHPPDVIGLAQEALRIVVHLVEIVISDLVLLL